MDMYTEKTYKENVQAVDMSTIYERRKACIYTLWRAYGAIALVDETDCNIEHLEFFSHSEI